MKKIRTTSHLLSLFFNGLCWVFPLLTVYFTFFYIEGLAHWTNLTSTLSDTPNHAIHNLAQFSFQHRLVLLMIEAFPISITVLICRKLAKLFGLFEQGYLFERENIQLIKSIGILMIAGELLALIYQPLMTIALSFNNPVGERFASITFGSTNMTNVITALIIIVASWVVQEAHQLKSDTQLTI